MSPSDFSSNNATNTSASASATWNDFNDADQQPVFDLIPHGKLAKVRMIIKRGGHDNAERGWTGGYATLNTETASVYLACEFVVVAGEYAKRKLWSNIGLHSPKSGAWAKMGRAFIRALLNSARRLMPSDRSPAAQSARRINGFFELDGIVFVARIEIEKETRGDGSPAQRNVIRFVIEPDHKDYLRLMNAYTSLPEPPADSASEAPGAPTWA